MQEQNAQDINIPYCRCRKKELGRTGIYYGEFDPEKYKEDKRMPILDLSMFHESFWL